MGVCEVTGQRYLGITRRINDASSIVSFRNMIRSAPVVQGGTPWTLDRGGHWSPPHGTESLCGLSVWFGKFFLCELPHRLAEAQSELLTDSVTSVRGRLEKQRFKNECSQMANDFKQTRAGARPLAWPLQGFLDLLTVAVVGSQSRGSSWMPGSAEAWGPGEWGWANQIAVYRMSIRTTTGDRHG